MKKALLVFLAFSPISLLFSQNCMPDTAYQDSTGVFPPPFDSIAAPNGGINDCAVIGEPFEFPFTVGVGDSISVPFGGQVVAFKLNNIVVNAVEGLPEGVSYLCEPTNCIFEDNTIGCVVLKGTPTSANLPGDYDLVIKVTINFVGFPFTLPFTFPDANLAPGKYSLKLLANAGDDCDVLSNVTNLTEQVKLVAQPNPTTGQLSIGIHSDISGNFNLRVMDLLGNNLHREGINLQTGANSFDYDGSHLPNGLYFIVVENGAGSVAHKIIVQH